MTAPPSVDPASAALNVTGYVLAGGRSSRMKQDKAFLEHEGEPFIEHALRRLRAVCSEAAILSGPPAFERDALLSCYARLIPDADSGYTGPLAGVAAALADCRTDYALLLAIDQPEISTGLLQDLLDKSVSFGALASCFACGGRPEPLPLLICQKLLPAVLRAIRLGERRLLPTLQSCAERAGHKLLEIALPAQALERFTNLNTPDDLLLWQQANPSNHSDVSASETSNG